MRRWLDRLQRVESLLLRGMFAVGGLLVLFMALAVSWSVLARRFLGIPVAWATEVSAYLLLYMTFLTAPWLVREHAHVRVDILVNQVSAPTRRRLELFAAVVSVVAAGLLVWYGGLVSYEAARAQAVVTNILGTPKALLLAVIPLGSLLVLVQYLRHIVRTDRGA